MPPTAGSSTAEPVGSRFLFDLASPACWLEAERLIAEAPEVEWVPVHVPHLAQPDRSEIERRAYELGLPAVRWPATVPFDSAFAMRAATYAKGIGRVVAFSLAAFRQAYNAGRSLADEDSVLIAAAACEMHPKAVLKGASLRSTREALATASYGVFDVPAVVR